MKLIVLLMFFISTAHAEIFNDRLALNQLVHQIRDPQTDAKHFRSSLGKIGEYLALEVLQNLKRTEVQIETLTGGIATHHFYEEEPVLVTILRAGIPLYLGVQEVFPHANVGFFAMARNEETLKATTSYIALPDLKDKIVILTDTMVATGGSALDAIKLIEKRQPKQIILLCAIAAKEGIDRIKAHNPAIEIYAAAIDSTLNEKGYIVPGLGDAGDRSYGNKVH